ncbi:hypothetical protein ABW20_dc0100649 [Dactylellina cionopaga]|nr:hypothetical protein ABW20_dc0100649 [Dactylellina cionopaga]
MRFFSTVVSAFVAFAAIASAQVSTKQNAFTSPTAGDVIRPGDKWDIKWMNVAGGAVTITLMDGPANQLKPIRTIVANAPNTGSYTWDVPADIVTSGTYSLRISYDSNPNNYNYSDRFNFVSSYVSTPSASSTTAASTTSAASVTSGAPATTSGNTTVATSRGTSTSTRRTATSEPSSIPTDGAPPSAGSSTLSSPLAVILAVLAAAIFIH